MTKHGMGNPDVLDELHDRVRIFLRIKESHFNQADEKSVQTIIRYLQELDVLYRVPETEEYIFTQPGMRYAQAADIAEALVTSDVFDGFSKEFRRKIRENIWKTRNFVRKSKRNLGQRLSVKLLSTREQF